MEDLKKHFCSLRRIMKDGDAAETYANMKKTEVVDYIETKIRGADQNE